MAINISEARVQQVQAVITKFSNDFSTPLSDHNTTENIISVFDPDVQWYDHGFFICRVGHSAVMGLHKAFHHCNQPFKPEIKGLYPTAEGGVLEMVWHGRCVNDIVRPDGAVVMKGSGKDFVTHVCLVIRVSEDGRIARIDEYDHRYWDEGRAEADYLRMDSAAQSLKSGV